MAKTQDYRLGEFNFPRGWFVVAESSQIGTTPHSDRFFGEDVVLYRGASGQVIMLRCLLSAHGYASGQEQDLSYHTGNCLHTAHRMGLDARCTAAFGARPH